MPLTIDDETLLNKLECEAARTSYPILSDLGVQRGKSLVDDTERALATPDLEIGRSSLEIAHLTAKRNEGLERLAKLRADLAPHKRLHADILTEIFVGLAEPEGPAPVRYRLQQHEPMINVDKSPVEAAFPPNNTKVPWVLMQVCMFSMETGSTPRAAATEPHGSSLET